MITSKDLYFHVSYMPDDLDIPIVVYMTPIEYWEEEGCLADNFYVNSEELASQFEAAGLCSSELMESVYELKSYSDNPTIESVTARLLEHGFQQDEGFSAFLNEGNENADREYDRAEAAANRYEQWDDEMLKNKMHRSAANEDYETAAIIRDELARRKNSKQDAPEPYTQTKEYKDKTFQDVVHMNQNLTIEQLQVEADELEEDGSNPMLLKHLKQLIKLRKEQNNE